jgi:hypothetical protein
MAGIDSAAGRFVDLTAFTPFPVFFGFARRQHSFFWPIQTGRENDSHGGEIKGGTLPGGLR